MPVGLDHPVVATFLARLEAAAAGLPPGRRAELVAELREHLGEALAGVDGDEAAVRQVVERLGSPDDIVAAEEAVPVPVVPGWSPAAAVPVRWSRRSGPCCRWPSSCSRCRPCSWPAPQAVLRASRPGPCRPSPCRPIPHRPCRPIPPPDAHVPRSERHEFRRCSPRTSRPGPCRARPRRCGGLPRAQAAAPQRLTAQAGRSEVTIGSKTRLLWCERHQSWFSSGGAGDRQHSRRRS